MVKPIAQLEASPRTSDSRHPPFQIKHPTAFITVGDLDAIYNMDSTVGEVEELDEEIKGVDDEGSETDMTYLCEADNETVEENLSNMAYRHGCQAYFNESSPT